MRIPQRQASFLVLCSVVLWLAWTNGWPTQDLTSAPIETAFVEERSGVWVEERGSVVRVLADDEEGDRHQRFILRLASGHSLLVSHNIDLAPRVSGIAEGDEVHFRGRYEWNQRGGVLHWTHHDPNGNHEGGWLETFGKRYR